MSAPILSAPSLLLYVNKDRLPCRICGHISPYMTKSMHDPGEDEQIVQHVGNPEHWHIPLAREADDPQPLGYPTVPLPPELGEHVCNLTQLMRDQRAEYEAAVAAAGGEEAYWAASARLARQRWEARHPGADYDDFCRLS